MARPSRTHATGAQQLQAALGHRDVQRHVLRLRSSVDQPIPANTFQVGVWDSLDYGPTGMFDPAQPDRFSILDAGTYSFQPFHDPSDVEVDQFDIVFQTLGADGTATVFHRVHPKTQPYNDPFEFDLESGSVIQIAYDNQSGVSHTVAAVANSAPRLTLRLVLGTGLG